jgi:hypothetical protein
MRVVFRRKAAAAQVATEDHRTRLVHVEDGIDAGNEGGTAAAGKKVRSAHHEERADDLNGNVGTGERTKVSFLLARDLHMRLKIEAARQGKSIMAMVSEWVAKLPPV